MLEPEKVCPIGEFTIVAKFGGHVLRHLPSRLANVIRRVGGGRQAGRLIQSLNQNPLIKINQSMTHTHARTHN